MASTNTDERNLSAVKSGGQVHEDVIDRLYDISPEDRPFVDMCAKGSSENHLKGFVEEQLEAADPNNAVVDGADATGNDSQLGQRKGNYHQTMRKVVQVSTRARNVNVIGANDELVKQVSKRQRALRRDEEARLTYNKAANPGDGNTTASELAGIGSWIGSSTDSVRTVNDSRGSGGSSPVLSDPPGGYPTTAPVSGTKRALSESNHLKPMIRAAYLNGGNLRYAMGRPPVIELFSDYLFSSSARVATMYTEAPQGNRQGVDGGNGSAGGGVVAQGAVNIYVSNYASLILTPNRFQPESIDAGGAAVSGTSDLFLIDPDLWEVSYLQGYRTDTLGKVGLSDRRQITVDVTLCGLAERGNAVVADIDETLAMVA